MIRRSSLFFLICFAGCDTAGVRGMFQKYEATAFEETIQISEAAYGAFLAEHQELRSRVTDPQELIVMNNFIAELQVIKGNYDTIKVDYKKVSAIKAKYPKRE